MEGPRDAATSGDTLAYAFKSSLMGAPFELRLTPEALEWSQGASNGRVPYGRIRRIRLGYRPMTMQNYRFLGEIWPVDGRKLMIASTSCKSLVEHQRLDAPYRAFVTELCRRTGASGGQTIFQAGSPAVIYWLGVAVFVGAALALAGLIVRALQVAAWSGSAFIVAFLGFFLWQAGNFFRRNRPGLFRPEAVPETVLPRG
jgi:hypothetical protein